MDKHDAEILRVVGWLTRIELGYCFVAPVHLWGWERGLLVFSALTSLLHIVALLKVAALRSAPASDAQGEKP